MSLSFNPFFFKKHLYLKLYNLILLGILGLISIAEIYMTLVRFHVRSICRAELPQPLLNETLNIFDQSMQTGRQEVNVWNASANYRE